MITLKKATIYKYKCVENEQAFDVEPDITVLVGMNESGKTSLLEALAKVNYFDSEDEDYKFNMTHDYPRKQKKAAEKSGQPVDAVKLDYEMDDSLLRSIEEDISLEFKQKTFSYTKNYNNRATINIVTLDTSAFVAAKLKAMGIAGEKYISLFSKVTNQAEFDSAIKSLTADGESSEHLTTLKELKPYFANDYKWNSPISEYIWREHIEPNVPKFMYYDDYYMLPSRISIDKINDKKVLDNSEKTARALLELAEINTANLVSADSYEDFKAELEATQAIISEEMFKYWSTNQNLRIQFDIDKVEKTDTSKNRHIVDHVLDIRVANNRSGVSLPLANRSKGFNWFFSFLVWFKKIQEDRSAPYILLLDEPGLNLHAMAQHDLLRFIEDLSDEYQIIYTTHSPFMIGSDKLNRVRTVLEKQDGTQISDCVQEKDPNTLFPLQAALGYTIAQNLFVSEKNLLVEGIADLVYLNIISNILSEKGRESLKKDITIVPVGGADKVATFISLLRGNDLSMLCLLDTFTDPSAKARLDNMITQNIIKEKRILFYHDILGVKFADVEDLFTDADYLTLYNGAFSKKISKTDIDEKTPIMQQLKKKNGGKDFNHYPPANYMAKNIANLSLSNETLDNFEELFRTINKRF